MNFNFDNMNIQPNSGEQPPKQEIEEKSKEEFENEVIGIKKELFENAGNKNKEELIRLIDDVEKIFSEEKESGKGRLKDKISEISNSEYGKEKFVDDSVVYLPKDGEAIFIGDTHGDPDATVSIIEQEKFIEAMERGEKDKQIVFLGDYADRGKGDVENLEQIFALKQKYPDNVTLLRGNHEEKVTSEGYGLLDSLKNKYREKEGIELFEKYNKAFENMPGVLVCENGIVAVHGGIPSEDINSLKDLNDADKLLHMRWNDPIHDPDMEFNQERTPGKRGDESRKQFGHEAFKRFMDTMDGKIMVRAHEHGKDKPIFKNRLVTLFSNGNGGEKSYYKDANASYAKFDLEKEIDEIDNENIKKLKYVKPNYELKQSADDPITANEDISFEDEPVNLNSDETTREENIKQENENSNVDESFEFELDEAIKKGEEDETLDEKYEDKRLAEWKGKTEKEKKETIKEKKLYFEENLEDDLKKDSENIDELEVPEGIMEEINKLQEYKKRLKDINTDLIEKRGNALGEIDSQIDGNINISNLSSTEQGEFRNVFSDVRNVTQNTLDIEKIDYYLTEDSFLTKEGIEKGLLKTHEDRLIAMEKLEYLLKQIGEFEKCLEEIGDVEAAREDIEKMVNRMIEIADENPSLFEKLKDAGIITGIIMLALAVGAAGVAKLIGIAGPLAAKIYSKKIAIGVVGIGTIGIAANAGTIAGAIVGGGILLKVMTLIKDEKFRDDLSKALCGVGFPGWYKALGGKEAKASDSK